MAYRSPVTITDQTGSGSQTTAANSDALAIYAKVLRGELAGDAALRASQQMLEMITETIPQAIWWKDRACVFLGVNGVLARMAGLERSEMIGKSDFDMPWANGEPFGAKWYQDWDREVMESGEAQYGIREELTLPDGSRVWIETSKVPLRDFNGDVIGILGTFEDVTERHAADEEKQRIMEELDERVQARTTALRRANESLRREVEERIRLEAQERKQRAYAEALRDTAAAVAESLDLDEVLEKVLAGVDRLISNHLAAVILEDDSGAHTLAHVLESHIDHANPDCQIGTVIDHLPLLDALIEGDGPVIQNDLRGGTFGAATRSAIGTPIAVSDSRIGYIVVEAISPGFFTEGHAERLTAIADLAAAAISNAQLFSAEAELAALEERQRLARELHDAVSQTLWTANLVSESIDKAGSAEVTQEQIDRLRILTKGALAEMRTLLLELRPAALADTPFTELLDQLVDALLSRRAMTARVQVPNLEELIEPSPHAKHALYRIAQEALNNVARHASAKSVDIEVSIDGDHMKMTIRDDGVGFSPNETGSDRLGLSIMGERAHNIGARLQIDTAPGSGTTIQIMLPVQRIVSPQ